MRRYAVQRGATRGFGKSRAECALFEALTSQCGQERAKVAPQSDSRWLE